jgi:hypothetical protein
MTDSINHYPVLLSSYIPAAHPRDLSFRVVLVDRGEGRSHGRYVTAVQYSVHPGSIPKYRVDVDAEWQSGWEHGHYYCGFEDARSDYVSRVIERGAEQNQMALDVAAHINAGGAS